LISFPPGTEIFQFPGFASTPYLIQVRIPPKRWVSPFGNPRIKACCRLPEAYRKLQRPSSPPAAKASTKCAFLLDHITQRTASARSVIWLHHISTYLDVSNLCTANEPLRAHIQYTSSHLKRLVSRSRHKIAYESKLLNNKPASLEQGRKPTSSTKCITSVLDVNSPKPYLDDRWWSRGGSNS
jgi:hypothetical protein